MRGRLLAIVGVGALVGGACSGHAAHTASRKPRVLGAVVTTSTTLDPDTDPPPSTTTTVKHGTSAPGLGVGSRGPQVMALEQRLAALRYDVGAVDGVYDGTTSFAVTAFQKVQGMSRTGRATDDVVAALAKSGEPGALVPGGGPTRVEVDIPRQVLFFYTGGSLYRILPVSTGSGRHYCENGDCGTAVTPGGSFRVSSRIAGWHKSPLGELYNPLFFNGGIAIHGEPSVPSYPASHGCVRIPMSAADWFFRMVPNGTPVYVIGGPHVPPPVPFPDTTTTTQPPAPTTSTTRPPAPTTSTTRPTTTTTSSPPPSTSTTQPTP